MDNIHHSVPNAPQRYTRLRRLPLAAAAYPFNLQNCLEGRQDFRWRSLANCVALFALDKTEAFPVDSRVRNTVKRLYPSLTQSTDEEIITWAHGLFGEYAGYANQFLYMG